jgi:hypothetical protein
MLNQQVREAFSQCEFNAAVLPILRAYGQTMVSISQFSETSSPERMTDTDRSAPEGWDLNISPGDDIDSGLCNKIQMYHWTPLNDNAPLDIASRKRPKEISRSQSRHRNRPESLTRFETDLGSICSPRPRLCEMMIKRVDWIPSTSGRTLDHEPSLAPVHARSCAAVPPGPLAEIH